MNDADDTFITPLFAPRNGLTEEEQKKVEAFIQTNGVTRCPGMGSPELKERHIARYLKWLESLSMPLKRRFGFLPRKNEDRCGEEPDRRAYYRQYYQSHKEKKP